VTRQLPARYGCNPMTDIQVLVPQHRGRCGTVELNGRLQAVLNPRTGGPEIQRPGFVLRVGDKVMHVANSRELELQNGDMGWVSEIDLTSKEARLTALFDDREVTYNAGAVDQLVLGYAVTCHKSQGSEYPCVVIGMVGEHHQLLGRNLLYTAVTRGKQSVVLVTNPRTLRLALDETRREQRHTRLAARLRGEL
jgi:exodeoxyribonuclease V alpha subunit